MDWFRWIYLLAFIGLLDSKDPKQNREAMIGAAIGGGVMIGFFLLILLAAAYDH